MMKQFAPVILIIVSIAVFFGLISPLYDGVKERRAQIKLLSEALSNSRKVQTVRDQLLERYNRISTADLERLKKIVPDHVDNVRLLIEVDRIATRNGVVVQHVATRDGSRSERATLGPDESPIGTIRMNFSLAGGFQNIIAFLSELEQSLRVVDITAFSFTRGKGDVYEYDMEIQTYWLK